ncbi:hypothetical protein PR001_g23170 [Phytophthora rubi]|uniref:Reverse transcriptase domain-containing protein n=1 Tax=Phytophthora rubi TaxID=129364 RepID=A0A6A3IUA0_9STRA|nr:hypothetical protein PR001_g23170 [Phytophthora rubi]
MPWVAAWNKVQLAADSDHQETKLHVRSPDDPIRVKRPARIHPVPDYAADAVNTMITNLLDDFTQQLRTQEMDAVAAAGRWEKLKASVARRTRLCVRDRRRALRNTLKQKLTRLVRQQQRLAAQQAEAPLTGRLDPVPGAPPRSVHDKADILADAWQPILQQPAAAAPYVDEVVGWDRPNDTISPDQAAIAANISEDEVRAALRACKQGKAAGPDRLGNGWYRDYEDKLVAILAALFNLWYNAGHFPQSFVEADIILAIRVGITLPTNIHPNQNGFVPGRTIHETLDLYEAAQRMVIADPDQHDATALLLDFKKAYDSLDRKYMIAVLRSKSYPEKFIRAVEATHEGTTVQFLANGTKSRKIEVTSGIRQGCPLAPLLFILALDPLYRRLDGFMGIRGVVAQSAAGTFELRVAGYADDTAAFVRHPRDIPLLLQALETFGNASGLQINTSKTMVIALHPDGPQSHMHLPSQLQFQDRTAASRYLGLLVGSKLAAGTAWKKATEKLAVRLRLASQKTLTVDQRSLIAGAIIVPNLLYIARHEWPA